MLAWMMIERCSDELLLVLGFSRRIIELSTNFYFFFYKKKKKQFLASAGVVTD